MEAALKIQNDIETLAGQRQLGAGFLYLRRALNFKRHVTAFEILRQLEAMAKSEPFFFFERSRDKADRFEKSETVVGFGAIEKILGFSEGLRFFKNGEMTFQKGSPYVLFSEHLKKYKTLNADDFGGGAFGYFGYESVRSLEPTLKNVKGTFSLVTEKPDLEFVFFENFFIFDHVNNRVSFVSGFRADEKNNEEGLALIDKNFERAQALVAEAHAARSSEEMTSSGLVNIAPLAVESTESSLGKLKYLDGVAQIKEHIAAGDIFQAVLSEKFEFDLNVKPLKVFETLNGLYPAPYSFYFSSGANVFLGASPEMLLRSHGGHLETHPIAGTRPRGKNFEAEKKLENELKSSEKENAEHLMLVDLARNDLGRISRAGTVKVPERFLIKKFPGVMHLVSKVTGTLKADKTAIDALASCFPAGTLSGAPKVRAMEILSQIEITPRGFYGGAVVLAGFNGNLDSCIAIRSLSVERNRAVIQAGAGIVADSDPQAEYEEILHKTKALRTAVAIAQSHHKVSGAVAGDVI